MKYSVFQTIAAIIYAIFGIGFLLAPGQMGTLYGLTFDADAEFPTRVLGAAVFSLAALAWLSREDGASRAGRAVIAANLVYDVLGIILALIGIVTPGLLNSFGWTAVLAFVVLIVGYGYFYFVKPEAAVRTT